MTLKSLELSGFKSFAKKSTLSFESAITSVVGPNGSGKSNVVEAIRFVLGEQSMKSLRGKGGADLIFKGSKSLPKLSRASVSITFNNKNRIFALPEGVQGIDLGFDEVVISREVYADGTNRYLLNGSEVRLKDILEVLARVHIGVSNHHIISQGEADRVLSSSSRDRRQMIEDALGLKVYQYKIRESERKLEKTRLNMKEVSALRREIAPHITYLKKQVEKIEKAGEFRRELEGLYEEYLKREELAIDSEKNVLSEKRARISRELAEISHKLLSFKETPKTEESETVSDIRNKENSLNEMRGLKDSVSRKLGRIEGMLELEARRKPETETGGRSVPYTELKKLESEIADLIDQANSLSDISGIKRAIFFVGERLKKFIASFENKKEIESAPSEDYISELSQSRDYLIKELGEIGSKEREIEEELENLRLKSREEDALSHASERESFELSIKEKELRGEESMLSLRTESLERRIRAFEDEIKEASVLIGQSVLAFRKFEPVGEFNQENQDEAKRKIERLKIKLEDIGASGGSDTLKEYEEVTGRDQFLVREVADLEASISSLESLISELKLTLDKEFKDGVEKINREFQTFFELMFGGGTAFLSIIVEHKKKRKGEEDEVAEIEDEELEFERGIEINVSLPNKKTKELQMLSGGERSLTSIALLFAMSQVNPPPFLVLDETDAALDEANSRRYGDMLERLAKSSQLIVVTHNRETMSRANTLYGVTVGGDGGSKLLSVKFNEAQAYAK